MRVGILSDGEHLAFSARLQAEGCDVLVHIDNTDPGPIVRSGRGIVPMTGSWATLLSWCREGQDNREPVVLFVDISDHGERADEARKAGLHVVGGSVFCDRMEKDRVFGFSVAEQAGMMLPHFEQFSTISEAIGYAEGLGDQATYFKTDRFLDYNSTYGAKNSDEMLEFLEETRSKYGNRIKCIIQDKIDGVAISTARWFNGTEFVGLFSGLIEHKALLNDDVGPKTGCAVNAIWFYQDETSFISEALNWSGLAEVLRKYDAPPNIYDANAIITPEGNAYFLEWCARMGYDSEPTGQLLIEDFSSFLWNVATGQGSLGKLSKSLAYSTRLWVPPYPVEYKASVVDEARSVVGRPIHGIDAVYGSPFTGYGIQYQDGQYQLAASTGEVGLVMYAGRKLSVLNEMCVNFAKTLRPAGFCYRTDGDKVIAKDAEEVMKVASDLHKGLVL